MIMKARFRQIVLAVFCIMVAAFIALPLIAYFQSPMYAWEMSQPAFTQGGLEALVLFGVFAVAALFRLSKSVHVALLCVGAAIYLRLHAVELAFIFALVWLEGILATGAAISPSRGRQSAGALFSVRFSIGVCIWTLGGLLLSLLHLASAPVLLGYSVLLFAAALIKLRKKPFTSTALKYLTHRDRVVAISSVYVLISVLVLFARSSSVIDFDSVWYGLRSQWVLAPHGSIFDRLYLVGQVFHYPKLFEFLSLPASALVDFGFIYAINICVCLASGIAAFAFMRLARMKTRYALLVMTLVVSMPAMTTMAMTAKPDLLGSYFLLLGSLFFAGAMTRDEGVWFLGAFAAVLLGLSTKLSAIPFGGVLSVAALVALGIMLSRQGIYRGLGASKVRGPILFLFVVSGLIFLAFSWRTYLMTGYPILGDKLITGTFDMLGFQPRYPAHVRTDESFVFAGSRLSVLYDYLFRPTELSNVSFVWPGNAGVLLFGAGCISAVLSRPRSTWIKVAAGLAPIVVAACLLMISYGNNAGGDGNYYIFPFTLSVLLGIGLIWQSASGLRLLLLFIVPAFVVANTFVGFLISPGAQRPGTDSFSFNLAGSPLHTEGYRDSALKAKGLFPIEQFMARNMGADCRAAAAGDWQGVYMLPCTTENFAVHWQANPVINSEAAFVKYLNFAKINLLISPKFPANTPFFNTAECLRESGLPGIETPGYFLVDLRQHVGSITIPTGCTPPPGTPIRSLTDILHTSTAVDLSSPDNPRPNLYSIAPSSYEFFTESRTLLVQPDVAVRFPINGIGVRPPWTFSASIGFTPEDSQHEDASMTFGVRVLGADGRELAAQSWGVSAGQYRSISFGFHATKGVVPMYLEIRYSRGTIANQQPVLLVGEPGIHAD